MVGPPLHPFAIKLGRIGDMVMLTAPLGLLHARYARPCYVVGADSWAPDVYLGLSEVAKVWALPRKSPSFLGLAWPAILGALRASAPGPVYVFEHHRGQVRRIRRLLALSGIDQRRCLFIDGSPGTERAWLDALLRFARRTPPSLNEEDYPPPTEHPAWSPRLRVLAAERLECGAWLRAHGFRGQPVILIQPGNHRTMGRRRLRNWRGRDDKAWPPARWAELLRLLRARMPEAMLIVRGAEPEIPFIEAIRAAAPPGVIVAGTGVRQLFALCEIAHSMIAVDSGPAHAAAALGVPLVVLYGAQPAGVWLPRSRGSPVIPLGGPPELDRADQITVDSAFDAWCGLAGARGGQAAAQAEPDLQPAPLSIQTTSVRMDPSALSSSVR